MSESNHVAATGFSASENRHWPAGTLDGIVLARCLAFLADLLIVSILIVLASIFFGFLGILTFGLLWPGAALTPLIGLAYFTFTLGGRYSATPGMRWQGIELRTWNGRRPKRSCSMSRSSWARFSSCSCRFSTNVAAVSTIIFAVLSSFVVPVDTRPVQRTSPFT